MNFELSDETVRGRDPDPPEIQLREAMLSAGFEPPNIVWDGKIHRFKHDGSADAGWYHAHLDSVPAGEFGSWKDGSRYTWRADIGRQLTPMEEVCLQEQMEMARQAREKDKELRQRAAALKAQRRLETAKDAKSHPYLRAKGIRPHGVKISNDGRIMVPMAIGGEVTSIQYIDDNGRKLFLRDGATKGANLVLGNPRKADLVYLVEGFATGATVYEQTGVPTVVAFSAQNLPIVARSLKSKLSVPFCIIADNDPGGAGQNYATQAAAETGCRWVMPPALPERESAGKSTDANDWHLAGRDLADFLKPPDDGWLVPLCDVVKNLTPVRWLIKRWIQREGAIMVLGPSGVGKSFLVIDLACRIACDDVTLWHDRRVRHGPVAYLAGEGHAGIATRFVAWLTYHGKRAEDVNIRISSSGTHLDTPEGYQRARDAIAGMPEPPVLIAVDTLHRHMAGDENTAVDTAKMLHYGGLLMSEFESSLLFVHHVGNGAESQTRARGSSAWKGALENNIVLKKGDEPGQIEVIAEKTKEGREPDPVLGSLEVVDIPGLVDEDGEQVSSVVFSVDSYNLEGLTFEPPPSPAHRTTFARAWHDASCTVDDAGRPTITTKHIIGHIVSRDGASKKKAQDSAKELTDSLVQSNQIEEVAGAWVVVDESWEL